jgi:predicted TIM-barrel fold metal-dependent hydrolase
MAGIISADSHVNEVPETWERVQKQYGDRAPKVVWNPSDEEVGPYLVIEGWGSSLERKNRESCAMEYVGMIIGGLGMGSAVGRTSKEATEFRKNFRFEDWRPPWDPQARLEAMDKDGAEAEVLYASHLRHFYELSEEDESFFRAIAHSYNEWLLDFCSYNPKRLIGLPVLSVLDVEGAVEDLQSYAKRGAHGFMVGSSVPVGMSYGDSMFDPLWAAAQEVDLPISMHTTTGRWKMPKYHHPGVRAMLGSEAEVQTSLAEMVYGGVFDRFPRLKIVAAEFDIGWVAHAADRIRTFDPKLGLELAPAEYLERNVWYTFQDDRAGVLTTPMFGANRFLWSSDFPHGVTTWPDSQAIIDRQFVGVSDDIRRNVVRENTVALYNLDL